MKYGVNFVTASGKRGRFFLDDKIKRSGGVNVCRIKKIEFD